GNLIRGGAERPEHMRDGHAYDGDVEHFQDRREHHGDDQRHRRLRLEPGRLGKKRQLRADRRRVGGGGRGNGVPPLPRLFGGRLAPGHFLSWLAAWSLVVSIMTHVLAPTLSGLSADGLFRLMRTGKRWVTFTQLPLAFSGGSTENVAPEPELMLSTVP